MIGKCTKMCSFKEYHLRKEAKLLSRFETDEETCIAEFTRPGVGQMSNPSYIRTGNTLMKTTVFLLADILDFSRHGESWLYTTNFITDRLRQVRKETMQQEIKDITKVYILERIIRYHILLMYNNREYDVALNTSLFQTYLCDLLDVYSDYTEYSNFHEFRSYYLLNNISDSHLVYKELCNYYTFPNETYHSCIELATVFHTNNLYRFMRILAEKLTFLQACILINSLNNTRLSFLQMINKAFGLKFPISSLMKWLLFEKKADLITLLELLSIKFDSDFVYFSKEKTLSIDKLEMEKCTQNFSFSHILNMKFGDLTPSAISNGGAEFENHILYCGHIISSAWVV